MKASRNQQGFSQVIFLVIALLIVGVVSFAAFRVLSTNNSNSEVSKSPASTTSSDGAVPVVIESDQDLEQASDSLNQTNLDQDLNTSQLDQDINTLL